MFEEIDNGYTVIFTDGVNANATYLTFLKKVLQDFSKLLLIAENVHKSGSEELFKTFKNLSGKHSGNIRFLFAARREKFTKAKEKFWRPDDIREITPILKMIPEFELDFDNKDAELFLKQAMAISHGLDRNIYKFGCSMCNNT